MTFHVQATGAHILEILNQMAAHDTDSGSRPEKVILVQLAPFATDAKTGRRQRVVSRLSTRHI